MTYRASVHIVKTYDRDLNQDRNPEGLWLQLSHAESVRKAPEEEL